jgi:pimeloyl-ACP methyl ester carboxylesterase
MNDTFPSDAASKSFCGLVDIGERRLFAEVAGSGVPTVVLEAGRGALADTWEPIWADLTTLTRVVRYDRAGLDQSDPVGAPRSGADLVADLHQLLQVVARPGPYILVGHSVGGLTIRLYAHMYPHDGVGMILVDPTHHNSFARERAVLPAESPSDSAALREMREQLNQPPVPSGDDLIDTLLCQEQARGCESLGAMPLIVLTGMRRRRFADILEELIAGFYALKWELHQDFARLSEAGMLMGAEHSGHDIPTDEPVKILEAIRILEARYRGVLVLRNRNIFSIAKYNQPC